MKVNKGFHKRFPTAVADEIELAHMLHLAANLRWGVFRLRRMLRTDPAYVMGRMAYCRSGDNRNGFWGCVAGIPVEPHTRATNADILTPSHPEWSEFQERLDAELACPDFEQFYGASQVVWHDSIEDEYWPLCSAQLIAELGFAVAESLAVMNEFLGSTDEAISRHVAGFWKRTKPSKHRPAFDASGVPSRSDLASDPQPSQERL